MAGHFHHQLLLQGREVGQRTVELLQPEDGAAFRLDQLRSDA
jgi:hypothetical protein